jgi:gas vesicle protein
LNNFFCFILFGQSWFHGLVLAFLHAEKTQKIMKKIRFVISVLLLLSIGMSSYAQKYVYKHKKGWSPKAKNAVIGAGAGAVIGALVDKNNHGVGALIGGAVGGGAGYLYGRHRSREIAEDRAKASTVTYKGYRTSRDYVAKDPSHSYDSYYLSSQTANAAYNDPNAIYAQNYYHNRAYGFQRRSW